jgi:hypothetical protein
VIDSRTALVVVAFSCLEACSDGPDPERVRALLIVVPGAHDVESTPQLDRARARRWRQADVKAVDHAPKQFGTLQSLARADRRRTGNSV